MKENQETELERKLRSRVEAEEAEEAEAEAEIPAPNARPSEDTPDNEEEADQAQVTEESAGTDELDPIQALEAEAENLKDQLLRARAEFDNFRKRTAREVERIRKTAAESVIHELLPVLDNLELALTHAPGVKNPLTEGVKMVLQQLLDLLERSGLEPIEAVGKPFDPNVHEAVSQIASDDIPRDSVAQEYQRGYKLGGQVLRPSKVVVSTGADDESASDEPKE